MKISELDYDLPEELIAQSPAEPRDWARMMVIDKKSGEILHKHFYDLPQFITSSDVLVFNQTKVFPARCYGKKTTGGKVEILFLKNIDEYTWEVITKPGIKVGEKITFDSFEGEVVSRKEKVATAKFSLKYL